MCSSGMLCMADFQLMNMFQVGTLHLVAVEAEAEAEAPAAEAEAEAPSAPSAAAEESAV